MKICYKPQFVAAMEQEINNNTSRKHWSYCEMSTVPCDQILRSTWTFRIKRNRSTNEIIKFKARFCADGRRQEFGVNYNETHAPVVKWVTMRTCLTLSILHKWQSRAIDFDQAHTKADCDTDVYLHPPASYSINSSTRYVLKLIKNLYGLKQGGHNFYENSAVN